MRTPIGILLILLLFFSLGFSVHAAERIESRSPVLATGLVAGNDSLPLGSGDPILPLSVHGAGASSLSSISITEKSTVSVLERERAAYQSVRSRLSNASAAEQSGLRSQLSIQRHRFLLAILNRLTVIYQRADYVVARTESSLLRLDILHDRRGGVSNYSSRFHSLQQESASLRSRSDEVARLLESCPGLVDLNSCVRESRDALSSLLSGIPPYYSAYRGLAADVLSSS